MPINMPINSITQSVTNNRNIIKKIDVDNTYSIKNAIAQKNIQKNATINNNMDVGSLDPRSIRNLRAEVTKIERPSENITNVLGKRENVAPRMEINELKASVKNAEKSQVKNIEEWNATIAQGTRPIGAGARLVGNFFTNQTPNIGGKIDTVI